MLVVEHTEEDAMGLVLNRPSMVPVAEAAPEIAELVDPVELVHVGGPVTPEGIVVLAEFDEASEAALMIDDEVGIVHAEADVALVAAVTRRARAFAGHAGWAPGQLEAELADDGWIAERPAPGEILADEPERLWSAVLERKGGQFAVLARMPLDPSVN